MGFHKLLGSFGWSKLGSITPMVLFTSRFFTRLRVWHLLTSGSKSTLKVTFQMPNNSWSTGVIDHKYILCHNDLGCKQDSQTLLFCFEIHYVVFEKPVKTHPTIRRFGWWLNTVTLILVPRLRTWEFIFRPHLPSRNLGCKWCFYKSALPCGRAWSRDSTGQVVATFSRSKGFKAKQISSSGWCVYDLPTTKAASPGQMFFLRPHKTMDTWKSKDWDQASISVKGWKRPTINSLLASTHYTLPVSQTWAFVPTKKAFGQVSFGPRWKPEAWSDVQKTSKVNYFPRSSEAKHPQSLLSLHSTGCLRKRLRKRFAGWSAGMQLVRILAHLHKVTVDCSHQKVWWRILVMLSSSRKLMIHVLASHKHLQAAALYAWISAAFPTHETRNTKWCPFLS